MKKNIDLVIDGIAPEKVMYDTDNHSLVVLYPAQREFKRGDVLKSKSSDVIFILDAISPKPEDEEWCSSIIGLNFQGILVQKDTYCWGSIHNTRLATPEEQQILFDALAKEGKKWNKKTLQVEDLVKKGGIVIHDNTKRISIFDSYRNKYSDFKAIFSIDKAGNIVYNQLFNTDTLRYATSSEIEQLDNKLKSVGKKWNKETLEIEDLDISEIAVDLKTAIDYLDCPRYTYNIDKKDKRLNKFEAQITLQLIREAWNKADGFVADLENSGQSKYYPIINLFTGNIEVGVSCVSTTVHSACYSFKSKKRALQFGTQFKELFREALGM